MVFFFQESVDWFTSNPHISDTGIGVTGLSYGSSAAMLMAIYSSKAIYIPSLNIYLFLSNNISVI